MNTAEFQNLCYKLVDKVKANSPIDTGNLRYNGIRFEFPSPDVCEIYVDPEVTKVLLKTGEPISYMVFTNEPWLSSKWHGKKNPNEAWWQNTISDLVDIVVSEYKGKVI